MRIPFLFLLPGVVYLFPVISRLHGAGETEQISRIRSIAYSIFIPLGLLIGVFFWFWGPSMAHGLFGPQFILSGETLVYACWFLVFNFLLQIEFQIFSGTGRVREKMWILVGAIILNFFTNLILIPRIGIGGAALATGVGWVAIWLVSAIRNRSYR